MADDHHFALDSEGHPVPGTPAEAKAMAEKLVREGELLAIISRQGNDIGVVVMGEPSLELCDALETAAIAYRRGIRGH